MGETQPPVNPDIEAAEQFYRTNKQEIDLKYAGEFAAILHKKIFDHDPDLGLLVRRVHTGPHGNNPIWIAPIPDPDLIVDVPSALEVGDQ